MITRVRVKNFRSLADVDVTLGPMTVLVGENGAGKSAFLDVLRFVRDALLYNLEYAISRRHGIDNLLYQNGHTASELEIFLAIEKDSHYSFTLARENEGKFYVRNEHCIFRNENFGASRDISQKETELLLPALRLDSLPALEELYRLLTQMRSYAIFPNTLRLPQEVSSETILKDDASNLATVLKQIKKENQWQAALLSSLKYAVSDVTDFDVETSGGYLVTRLKHKGNNGSSPWFNLSQESDGTIRLLALLAALYQQPPGSLTAIEEPELSLYPNIMGRVGEDLREAALRTQVLITTQSPDLISRFTAEELRVVERTKEGTYIGPIAEHQIETINQKLFSGGDLMRIEGLRSKPVVLTGVEDD
jgi:predicted ATPase